MKTTKIIGKKVLDCNANEIGKVNEIDLDLKTNEINHILISSGELSLRKVVYEVSPDSISKVGDYILLNKSKSELSSNKENEEDIPDVEIVNPEDIEEKK